MSLIPILPDVLVLTPLAYLIGRYMGRRRR